MKDKVDLLRRNPSHVTIQSQAPEGKSQAIVTKAEITHISQTLLKSGAAPELSVFIKEFKTCRPVLASVADVWLMEVVVLEFVTRKPAFRFVVWGEIGN